MDDGRIASPATERYAKKKEAILAAATAILNRQGVKGMTLADVAAKVGLITTSVTYYYRKKDDLAAACFMRGLERFDALVTEAGKAPDAPSRLLKFLDLYLDLNRRVRLGEAAPLTSFTEMRALKEPLRGSVQGAFNDLFRRVRGFFEGQEFDHLDKRDRNARTHLLLEQVFWSGSWLRRYDVDDYGRVRDKMYDILVNGLAATGRTWEPLALPDPTPHSPDGQEWRETFLVAATRLINQRGYRGASVEDISAQLNVTKGSFYHHHEDKDALVVECSNAPSPSPARPRSTPAPWPGTAGSSCRRRPRPWSPTSFPITARCCAPRRWAPCRSRSATRCHRATTAAPSGSRRSSRTAWPRARCGRWTR